MSSINEDVNPRRMGGASKEEVFRANVTYQRPHHRYRRGGGAATRLISEVAQKGANMRDIAI